MVSSLAAQLAQGTSLNTSLLLEKSRRKPGVSYLFTGREADQHDIESIHALGSNGFLQLKSLDPSFGIFHDFLFSDAAKATDRTLQSVDVNGELDRKIAAFLKKLGPYLMETPTGKVIEWLVRRFRVNEFNVEDVLALFLPYHESPHFAKMLTILHIKKQSIWGFLLPFKSAAQSVPRVALVNEMLHNSDLACFVVALLPTSIKEGFSHRTLLVFNAATLHDFISCSKKLDEGTVAFVLPALVQSLQTSEEKTPGKDAILGGYVLLSALSQKCHLAPQALKVIVGAMAMCAHRVATKQFVNAVVSVCEPQDELETFSDATVKAVFRLSDIHDELRKASSWQGVEKFVCPLLPSVVSMLSDGSVSPILDSLLTAADTPPLIVQRVAMLLMGPVVSAKDTEDAEDDLSVHHRLLSAIQQRYPSHLQTAANQMILRHGEMKDNVEQLVISLSVVAPGPLEQTTKSKGPKDKADRIIASTSAQKTIRAFAVRDLLQILAGKQDIDASYLDSIHSALLARVSDSSGKVIDALYANPLVLLPVLIKNANSYISAVTSVLFSPSSADSIIFAHLTFLAKHFCPASPSNNAELFDKAFFPFLLFSKSRRQIANTVWEMLASKEADEGIGRYELFGGCVDAWKWEERSRIHDKRAFRETEEEAEKRKQVMSMSMINLAVSAKIAENILASNEYQSHFESLLAKLRDRRAHTRIFAYLIIRALFGRLSGEHQIDAALKVVSFMDIDNLDGMGDFMDGSDNLQEFLEDQRLGVNIVLKPSSRSTMHWLQISVLALFPIMSRPSGILLNWLVHDISENVDKEFLSDTRGARYVWLMRRVYRLANSSSDLPLLSTRLLQGLFVNLRDDALAFFAGVWTCTPDDEDHNWLRLIAFRHAMALLATYRKEKQPPDLQTIFPSLTLAMQSPDIKIREGAMECATVIAEISTAREASVVYGFDSIYGESSDKLQYLEWEDFRQYSMALVEYRDHVVNDANYVVMFHTGHLQREDESKKKAPYKQHVLCYLLSHVDAIRLLKPKMFLLKLVDHVSNEAKAQTLLPTILALVADSSSSGLSAVFGPRLEDFATSVMLSFDLSSCKDLNDQQSPLWSAFISSIRHYFKPGSLSSPRIILTKSLVSGLFAGVKFAHQVEICTLLLEIGADNVDAYSYCKELLGQILESPSLMVHLLTALQPKTKDLRPTNKRAKLDQPPKQDLAHDSLFSLSLLAEVLASISLPGSLDLVSCLLATLNQVVHYESPTQTDKSYIEQLLMSAVESAADKVNVVPNLSPSAIRLDILIELIRVAHNPQTFHQALLLVSSLVRLAPGSVIHNIMPVFTFMGSNVFHRDDSYSFRVVQKTIDSIVPVMVSSLKEAHSDRFDLYVASRDFLRIFTDASNHVPRHRRTNFFAHLVDVLGPEEFLAPVCMLLVDKVSNRVVRQTGDGAQGTLALPISIIQHYPPTVQIFVLIEVLRESRRLVSHIIGSTDPCPTFLEASIDEEPSSVSSLQRRRAQALIIFTANALPGSPTTSGRAVFEGGATSDLVSLLIDISTVRGGSNSDTNIDDISKAARSGLKQALTALSVTNFIDAVLVMLGSGDSRVQTGALDLLDDRLPNIADKTRRQITPAIVRIINSVKNLLSSNAEGPSAGSAFGALKAIGVTLSVGEESALTDTIPLTLAAIRGRRLASSALKTLLPIVSKVGPRIIPFFRDIVNECVSLLRDLHHVPSEAPTTVEDASSVLTALLTSIPTFWGSAELSQIVLLFVEHATSLSSSQSIAMSALVKAVSKRAPAKVLLPTIYGTWPSVAASSVQDRFIQYFRLLRRALRTASRPVVLEHIRALFNVFLEAFDAPQAASVVADEAGVESIAAFMELVVKLNEAAFRPLFRRLYDWAFADVVTGNVRKATFCHIYGALLDYFKGLMTPYMSFLLPPFVEVLNSCSDRLVDDKVLWLCIIQTLHKSFDVDEGAFWRDDKLRIVTPIIIEQVAVCIRSNITDGRPILPDCLVAMTDTVDDDALLKSINLGLLMHTRSDDARLRLFALTCSERIWRAHGTKLLGFVGETTTFVAETAEDENDTVVRESHKLKDAVEIVAGNINGL